MSWSYQDTMTTEKDKVRFYLGDTDISDQLVSDQEIAFALSEGGSVKAAAAICADALMSKFARLADLAEGNLKISYSQRFKQFRDIATQIRTRSILLAMPTAGAVFVADKTATEEDDSLVKPSFTTDMLDNSLVGGLTDVTRPTAQETSD